jgi:dipeptidase
MNGASRRVFGWGNTMHLTPEKIAAAKAWWRSLSINEQRAAKIEHLGPDFPTATVTSDNNLVWMWEGEMFKNFMCSCLLNNQK